MNNLIPNTNPELSGEVSSQTWPLVLEFLDHLKTVGMKESSFVHYRGLVKHLLVWLDRNNIKISEIDGKVLERFLLHSCDCPQPSRSRYKMKHKNQPRARNVINRFVQFLEQTARIKNPSSLDEGKQRITDYTSWLTEQGYKAGTIRHVENACRHFVIWLNQHHIAIANIDDETLKKFEEHECFCPGQLPGRGAKRRMHQREVTRFSRFLTENGVIAKSLAPDAMGTDEMRAFRDWLRRHRGIKEVTIRGHVYYVKRLRRQIGDDPSLYDAALIRKTILKNLESGSISQSGAKSMCSSLRMYLRFLASRGVCSLALINAIPRIPCWRLETLPRYILADEVERVIASCDLSKPRGIRDQAILLLLARLALRAGDVVGLRLEDIDWDTAQLRVAGKTKHEIALPLPQDVGDALLTYIEKARPRVASSRVFIRTYAPFVPLSSSSAISSVVREALQRAGVDNPNLRGAYLLRHSAATNMLRSGATLEAVAALLRHKSLETTAIYAKVDTVMLQQVAQPWVGGAS